MTHLAARILKGPPRPVNPVGACGHMPYEMPGIVKVVAVVSEGGWLVRVFPDSGKNIASGGGLGLNIAAGLYQAIEQHNIRVG